MNGYSTPHRALSGVAGDPRSPDHEPKMQPVEAWWVRQRPEIECGTAKRYAQKRLADPTTGGSNTRRRDRCRTNAPALSPAYAIKKILFLRLTAPRRRVHPARHAPATGPGIHWVAGIAILHRNFAARPSVPAAVELANVEPRLLGYLAKLLPQFGPLWPAARSWADVAVGSPPRTSR